MVADGWRLGPGLWILISMRRSRNPNTKVDLGLGPPLGVQTREQDDCRCKGPPKGMGVKLLYSFIFAHRDMFNMILKSYYTQQEDNDRARLSGTFLFPKGSVHPHDDYFCREIELQLRI